MVSHAALYPGESAPALLEKEWSPLNQEGEDRKEEQREMRQNIRENCRSLLLEEADRRDSILTRRDVKEWLTAMEEQNLRGDDIRTEADKTKVVRELFEIIHTKHVITDARQAGQEALRLIADAAEKKWILPSSAKEWRDRVKDESYSAKEKKEFIEKTLPGFYENWKQISIDYKKVRDLEQALGLSKEEARKFKELSNFHDSKFMSGALDYPERRKRVTAAKDFLETLKKEKIDDNMKELPPQARAHIRKAVDAEAVDELRVSRWLREKLNSLPTDARRQEYVAVYLPEYLASCRKTRAEFDNVEAEMNKNGIPWGFNPLTPEKFISSLTLAQRKSYVETARARMREEEPHMVEMKNLKFGIWHALDTKDWEEAEELLKKARMLQEAKKGTKKDGADLDVMARNLEAFRAKETTEGKPGEDRRKTLEDLRAAYAQIPAPLQPLYLSAMNDPDKLGAIASCIYNRVWCREHGYLTDDREKELEQEATTSTQALAKEGKHRKKGLDNVKLGVVTDTQHDPAVRRYDEGEWAPTIIHMPPDSHQHFNSILETRKNNHAFRYWTTLIPTNVTYEQQYALYKNVNWVLKSGTKKLKEQGLMFTLTGNPPSLN